MREKRIDTCDSDKRVIEQLEEQGIEESCGIQAGCGSCRTKRILLPCCECGNNAKCFLFFISIAVLVQGIVVNGLINIIISTIEKRFHLQSSETGFIAGCYDLGFLLAVTLVTYVGGRGSKPEWIGWGILVMGLGSITFSLPHFIAPTYTIPDAVSYICDQNATLDQCGKTYLKVYQAFFIVGHILHGIGACGLFTLTITYIDANVKKTKSALYQGVFFACSVAGPGIGFIAGGALTQLYTNLGERVEIDETSHHWIGNWWLGYLLCGIAAILISVPITFFPKELSNTAKYREDREEEIHENPEALQARGDENFGKRFRDIPRCLKVIFKNTALMSISFAAAMDSGSITAIATFGPKYVEAVHRLPTSSAGIYVGLATIVAACASHLLGGFIISRLNPGIRTMIKFCIACATLALCCVFGFMIKCDNPDVPGVNTPYPGESTYKCEGSCGCGTELYDPVCGADGLTYLSPCEAGCALTDTEEMVNCTRIVNPQQNLTLENAVATSGKCSISTQCPSAGLQITVAGFLVFFSFLKFQPALQISLRTVPFYQRSFAIGIQWCIMRCFGLIPLPLILGALLDNSCLVWEEVCGQCASCRLYDNSVMSNSLVILLVCAKVISIVSLFIALFTYKPPSNDKSFGNNEGKSDRDISVSTNHESSERTQANSHSNEAFENEAF